MSEWFSDLVIEIVEEWANKNARLAKMAEDLSNDVGNKGEECIRYRLGHLLGYYAEISPRSRTPADVYAEKDEEKFVHIAMVSVKSTATAKKAALLNSQEQTDAERFPEFVKSVIERYDNIPENRKIIISIGYAGVVFKNWPRPIPPSVDAYLIGCSGNDDNALANYLRCNMTGKDVYAKLCSL